MKPLYADVALRIPGRSTFTYEVPASLALSAERGMRVMVPVRRTFQVGVVWTLHDRAPSEPAKTVADVLDVSPVFNDTQLKLAEWLSDYYHAGLGETLFAILPAGLKAEIDTTYRHEPERVKTKGLTPAERKLCYFISEHPGATRRELLAAFPVDETHSRLEKLVTSGTVECQRRHRAHKVRESFHTAIEWAAPDREAPTPLAQFLKQEARPVLTTELEARFPGSARQVLSLSRRRLVSRVRQPAPYRPSIPDAAASETLVLTPEQAYAVQQITEGFGTHRTFLLHGVTGSGKTEVYIRSLAHALKAGRSALYLVPEISLADQLLIRLAPHFESQVVLLHSGLSERERASAWRAVAKGERKLVIGTRSACLAPMENLGLVIVDEEQDSSLKQDQPAPRYHGRDVAVWRAKQAGAVCVLGTATPSLETWHHARTGKYVLLKLPQRIGRRAMPPITLIDRRLCAPARPLGMITGVLAQQIESTLSRGEQCILFLNRRGFSGSLRCTACGHVPGCPDCSVAFAYHREVRQLRCHHCGKTEKAPTVCSACGHAAHSYPKAGTQQVESELRELFPKARVARLDLDSAAEGDARTLLLKFGRHEIDILLGTQMVTKGLHFPRVSLVGILNTDLALDVPDFRSAERTAQQVWQVAGRAGRGELPGSVHAQTYNPETPLFSHILRQDFDLFADAELETRRQLGFPPFHRAIAVWTLSEDEKSAESACKSLAEKMKSRGATLFRLLGPAPAPIKKIRRHYRWHFLLLTHRISATLQALDRALSESRLASARVNVDVDPVHLL